VHVNYGEAAAGSLFVLRRNPHVDIARRHVFGREFAIAPQDTEPGSHLIEGIRRHACALDGVKNGHALQSFKPDSLPELKDLEQRIHLAILYDCWQAAWKFTRPGRLERDTYHLKLTMTSAHHMRILFDHHNFSAGLKKAERLSYSDAEAFHNLGIG